LVKKVQAPTDSTAARAVPWARAGVTVVFGMGTGGAPPL